MKLIESSVEHRPHLQAAPLLNGARHYLNEVAAEMTSRGEVVIAEVDARSIVHSVTSRLRAHNQIATSLDPATVLHVLSEQIDYPSVAFRFQHQQFQEFCAAQFLTNALTDLVRHGDEVVDRAFAGAYINKPMWEQTLDRIGTLPGSASCFAPRDPLLAEIHPRLTQRLFVAPVLR